MAQGDNVNRMVMDFINMPDTGAFSLGTVRLGMMHYMLAAILVFMLPLKKRSRWKLRYAASVCVGGILYYFLDINRYYTGGGEKMVSLFILYSYLSV